MTKQRELVQEWLRLREEAPRSGKWPILMEEPLKPNPSAQALEAGALERWLLEAEAEAGVLIKEALKTLKRAHWPERVFKRPTRKDLEDALLYDPLCEGVERIVLVEGSPWQAAVRAGFGPEQAALHMGMHQRWHRLYQAEPVMVTPESVTFITSSPPEDTETLKDLVREHLLYNPDYSFDLDAPETITLKASLLAREPLWFLWWTNDKQTTSATIKEWERDDVEARVLMNA